MGQVEQAGAMGPARSKLRRFAVIIPGHQLDVVRLLGNCFRPHCPQSCRIGGFGLQIRSRSHMLHCYGAVQVFFTLCARAA